jgi:phosphate starvation-inducible PhoH-like protein
LSAKVLTPSGFKRMGDIHVGDDVIMPDGSATQVTDVFPQGKKPIYRVCLADGGSTLCTADHLWHVREEGEEEWKTITTAAILEGVKVGKRYELPEVRA